MQLNYEPLSSEVTKDDIKNTKSKYGASGYRAILFDNAFVSKDGNNLLVVLLLGVISAYVLTAVFFAGTISAVDQGRLFALALVLFFIILCVYIFQRYMTLLNIEISSSIRLGRFADVNKMVFSQFLDEQNHNGMIFNLGSKGIIYDQIKGNYSTPFEIGNYQCTVGSGRSSRTTRYGYVLIQLDRDLPQMVLDSKSNNENIFGLSISNLPISFRKDQKLSLEGDFDSHFTLYAPDDYKEDALCVFTPDLMSLFIDESDSFDAEVVGNQLYIYSVQPFNMSNRGSLERIFKIINTIGSKIVSQTNRHSDEGLDSQKSDFVKDDKRRLKKGISIATIIVMVIYAIYFGLTLFGQFLQIQR